MSPTPPSASIESPAISVAEPAQSSSRDFDPWAIDKCSDAELDSLPFGVICLDENGIILRYNSYEARMARLDRNQVLGRVFFGEIAPCTKNEEFEGRFRKMVVEKNNGEMVRFNFIFDFKFGAQDVAIEMLKAPSFDRYYLFVNRKRILKSRENIEPSLLPPLQRELAPNESNQGVHRDPYERRIVHASSLLWSALRTTCDRVAPKGWPLLCEEWGIQWGRRATNDLQAQVLENTGKELRELTMTALAEVLATYLNKEGWGSLTLDFAPMKDGVFVAHIERSALAESAGNSTEPRCHLMAGFFSAFFGNVAHKKLAVREALCAAQGHSKCSFLVAREARRTILDKAIGDNSTSLADILLRVRGA